MDNALLLSRTFGERRMALQRGGSLEAFQLEREGERGVVGNVYLGRVLRVLPGMQAAFVEIGLERAAFLYVGDAVTPVQRAAILAETKTGTSDEEEASGEAPNPISLRERIQRNVRIQDVVHQGETLLVQVTKDAMRTKGARITRQITLPGRFLVYMPGADHVGVSRRIENPEERTRLKSVVDALCQPGEGFIARTACEGRSEDELAEDVAYLREMHAAIRDAAVDETAPKCLHSDLDLPLRSLRDLLTDDITDVLVDDVEDHARVEAFVNRFLPRFSTRVQMWRGEKPLFEAASIDKGLGRALSRKVPLPSGGYLVIDHTEALIAIDVNTGRYVGSSTLEDTIVEVNIEAARVIPEQLRLRDIGGLIVIDFIDMSDAENRKRVDAELIAAMANDKARCSVLPISEFGLAQMTRHRVRDALGRRMTVPCASCGGEGSHRAPEVLTYDVLRAIEAMVGATPQGVLVVRCAPQVISWLGENEKGAVSSLEKRLGAKVRLEGSRDMDSRWSVSWSGM